MDQDEAFDPTTQLTNHSLPVSAAAAQSLDDLCAALATFIEGGRGDAAALSGCLAQITEWVAKAEAGSGNDLASSPWTADYQGVPDMGGQLICHKTGQTLMISLSADGKPYLGIGEIEQAPQLKFEVTFQVEGGPTGHKLRLASAGKTIDIDLPPATGGQATHSFLKGANEFTQALSGLVSPEEEEKAAKRKTMLPASPTVPANEPVQATFPAPVPEAANGKPTLLTPAIPPAAQQPDLLKCPECGNLITPSVRFCGRCGSRVNVVSPGKNCPKCGKSLAATASFCMYCGSPQAAKMEGRLK